MAWHLVARPRSGRALRFHEHTKEELAHYARAAYDVQFDFGGTLGFQEIEGVHNRGDFDLTRHQEYSGKKLEYFDQPTESPLCPVRHRDVSRRGPRDAGGSRERAIARSRLPERQRDARCSACIRRSRRSRPASSRW